MVNSFAVTDQHRVDFVCLAKFKLVDPRRDNIDAMSEREAAKGKRMEGLACVPGCDRQTRHHERYRNVRRANLLSDTAKQAVERVDR